MSLLSPPLLAFLAVVRHGTVHGAGKALRLTQTGVTQRIRLLERDLRATLFVRSRMGMKLTEEGEALLRYCQGAEELEGRALSQIGGGGKERTAFVTVAGPTSVMTARIVDQCAPLYAAWPNLNLSFLIADAGERIGLLRSGAATLAIVPPSQIPNETTSKRLKPDRYLLVASAAWAGRDLVDVLEHERIIDFDEGDPTTIQYLKKFGLEDAIRRPRLFVNNNEAIVKLFAAGVGFGTLTEEIARPHLRAGRLVTLNSGEVMEDPLGLAWYPRQHPPPYLAAIVDAIK